MSAVPGIIIVFSKRRKCSKKGCKKATFNLSTGEQTGSERENQALKEGNESIKK